MKVTHLVLLAAVAVSALPQNVESETSLSLAGSSGQSLSQANEGFRLLKRSPYAIPRTPFIAPTGYTELPANTIRSDNRVVIFEYKDDVAVTYKVNDDNTAVTVDIHSKDTKRIYEQYTLVFTSNWADKDQRIANIDVDPTTGIRVYLVNKQTNAVLNDIVVAKVSVPVVMYKDINNKQFYEIDFYGGISGDFYSTSQLTDATQYLMFYDKGDFITEFTLTDGRMDVTRIRQSDYVIRSKKMVSVADKTLGANERFGFYPKSNGDVEIWVYDINKKSAIRKPDQNTAVPQLFMTNPPPTQTPTLQIATVGKWKEAKLVPVDDGGAVTPPFPVVRIPLIVPRGVGSEVPGYSTVNPIGDDSQTVYLDYFKSGKKVRYTLRQDGTIQVVVTDVNTSWVREKYVITVEESWNKNTEKLAMEVNPIDGIVIFVINNQRPYTKLRSVRARTEAIRRETHTDISGRVYWWFEFDDANVPGYYYTNTEITAEIQYLYYYDGDLYIYEYTLTQDGRMVQTKIRQSDYVAVSKVVFQTSVRITNGQRYVLYPKRNGQVVIYIYDNSNENTVREVEMKDTVDKTVTTTTSVEVSLSIELAVKGSWSSSSTTWKEYTTTTTTTTTGSGSSNSGTGTTGTKPPTTTRVVTVGSGGGVISFAPKLSHSLMFVATLAAAMLF